MSRVEPSSFDSNTVYVSFDGHRSDDFRPYVYVSTDFGRTFRSISANLPATEYVHVIREHPRRRERPRREERRGGAGAPAPREEYFQGREPGGIPAAHDQNAHPGFSHARHSN